MFHIIEQQQKHQLADNNRYEAVEMVLELLNGIKTRTNGFNPPLRQKNNERSRYISKNI